MPLPEPRIPPKEDLEANVRWLRDVELIKALPQHYAYCIDEKDFQVVRSVFHPECRVVGTVHEGEIGAYLEVIQRRLPLWEILETNAKRCFGLS